MSALKWVVSAIVVPLIVGIGSSWVSTQTQLATLEERIAGVKESAERGIAEAKSMAQGAHDRIDRFLLSGGG